MSCQDSVAFDQDHGVSRQDEARPDLISFCLSRSITNLLYLAPTSLSNQAAPKLALVSEARHQLWLAQRHLITTFQLPNVVRCAVDRAGKLFLAFCSTTVAVGLAVLLWIGGVAVNRVEIGIYVPHRIKVLLLTDQYTFVSNAPTLH